MEKRVEMKKSFYLKQLRRNFILGIISTIIVLTLVCVIYNWAFKIPIISQSGITVLLENDEEVRVPKGFVIEGDAEEWIELDGVFAIEEIVTPYVATKSMVVKCKSGSESICVIYPPEYGTINNSHRDMAKKILK